MILKILGPQILEVTLEIDYLIITSLLLYYDAFALSKRSFIG